jgi:hypothetical protein
MNLFKSISRLRPWIQSSTDRDTMDRRLHLWTQSILVDWIWVQSIRRLDPNRTESITASSTDRLIRSSTTPTIDPIGNRESKSPINKQMNTPTFYIKVIFIIHQLDRSSTCFLQAAHPQVSSRTTAILAGSVAVPAGLARYSSFST